MAGHTKAYNNRRNAIRKAMNRIKGMQEQLSDAKTEEAQRYIQKQINEYNRVIETTRTYSKETGKRIRTSAEVAANVETLNRMNERYSGSLRSEQRKSIKASNEATKIEIARASRGEESRYTREQVHMFYRQTMSSWQNVPTELRNQAIMRDLGTISLAEAIDAVINDPKNVEMQWATDVIRNPEMYSDDDRTRAFEIIKDNEDDFIVSPPDGPGKNMPEQNYNPLAE